MSKKSNENLSIALHSKSCLFKEVPDDVLKTAMATITFSRGVHLDKPEIPEEAKSALKL